MLRGATPNGSSDQPISVCEHCKNAKICVKAFGAQARDKIMKDSLLFLLFKGFLFELQ